MAYPTTTAASDVWSLRDVYKAEAGDNWPAVGGGGTSSGAASGSGIVLIRYQI